MSTDEITTDTPSLDRAVILMQALEELLHELPQSPQSNAMQVLAANVTTSITRYQVSLFAGVEHGAT